MLESSRHIKLIVSLIWDSGSLMMIMIHSTTSVCRPVLTCPPCRTEWSTLLTNVKLIAIQVKLVYRVDIYPLGKLVPSNPCQSLLCRLY